MLLPLDLKDRVLDVQAVKAGGIRTDVGYRFGSLEVFILEGITPFVVATPDGRLRAQFLSPRDAVAWAQQHRSDGALPVSLDQLKRCARCRRDKAREAFGRDRSRPDGLHPLCRDCRRTYSMRWRRQRARAAGKEQRRPARGRRLTIRKEAT